MLDFDAEFQSMLQESTTQAKKGNDHMPHQRHEIIIPVSQIKRKMPEIGQIHALGGEQSTKNELAKNMNKMVSEKNSVTKESLAASNAVPPGGIKIAGSKMAFALITKTKQGKKIKVQKIAIDSESQLV